MNRFLNKFNLEDISDKWRNTRQLEVEEIAYLIRSLEEKSKELETIKEALTMMKNYEKFTRKELASIYNTLNGFEWDERLGDKPSHWDEMPDYSSSNKYFTKRYVIEPIMKEIKQIVGEKGIAKDWHLNVLHRTRLQFESYWLKRSIKKLITDYPL